MRTEPELPLNDIEVVAEEIEWRPTVRQRVIASLIGILLTATIATVLAGCTSSASAITPSESGGPSDADIVRSVQDWLAQQTYERLSGGHVADRLVTDDVGYKSYNCYDSISIESSPTWNVKWDGDRYEVTATLGSAWRGYQELTWDFYPATGTFERTHAGRYC